MQLHGGAVVTGISVTAGSVGGLTVGSVGGSVGGIEVSSENHNKKFVNS